MASNVNKIVNLWILNNPLEYELVFRLQQLLASRHFAPKKTMNNSTETTSFNTLLITEHKPVYTVGIRNHIYSSSEETKLKSLGADFIRTNRGGLITFHGPGQLVAYPILNLCNFKKSMKWYVCALEGAVIQFCDSIGVEAKRSSDTGVWVDNNKLCAIGVHGSRYVTTHGLALNCNTNLDWFSHIVPCGITNKGVTSLSKIKNENITLQDVLKPFLISFSKEFQCSFLPLSFQIRRQIIDELKSVHNLDPDVEKQLLLENMGA